MSSSKNITAAALALLVNLAAPSIAEEPFKFPEFSDREIELTIQSRNKRLEQAAAAQKLIATDAKTLMKQRDEALAHVTAIQLSERALRTEFQVVKDGVREMEKWGLAEWERAEAATKEVVALKLAVATWKGRCGWLALALVLTFAALIAAWIFRKALASVFPFLRL